jgi:hypothetical protein
MADRCSFCGSTAGPFSQVEGLFTVLMCADCQAARGRGSGPYPVVTRARCESAWTYAAPARSRPPAPDHDAGSIPRHDPEPPPHRHAAGRALLGLYLAVQAAAMTVQAIPDGDDHPRHGRPRGGWVVQLIDWVMGPEAGP